MDSIEKTGINVKEFRQASIAEKLDSAQATREIAASALHASLQQFLRQSGDFSEADLCDEWLLRMQAQPSLFAEGWYGTPGGIGVLFGNDKEGDGGRVDYDSLRPQKNWPSKNRILDVQNGLIYAYASPVSRQTGIIGDFGATLYFGKNKKIQKLLRRSLEVNRKISRSVEVGQKLSDVYSVAQQIIANEGLVNKVTSTTDISGVNIGHTIPASYEDWTVEEMSLIDSGGFEGIKKMLSGKRVFINNVSDTTVKSGMAFTIEPRMKLKSDPAVPQASYHTVCVVKPDGTVELLENFNELFKLVGMDYMDNPKSKE